MSDTSSKTREPADTLLGGAFDADGYLMADKARAVGESQHGRYIGADPFPHIAIDDFLDETMLELCLETFPGGGEQDSGAYSRKQENLKKSFNPDEIGSASRKLFYVLNSRPFLEFLEALTGIKGLIPDP